MSLFTILFIILNIIVAIKTRNLEPTKETYYEDDFDDHITYKDSFNKFYLKTAPSEFVKDPAFSKNYESDLVEIQEIKPWHKTKRSAIEKNKMSLVSPKPTRRVRHRGSLKQDEHLKLPHFKMVDKTIDKTDLYNEEVMKSNTDTYTLEERNDNGIKKINDTAIHHNLSDEMENSDLDIKKDPLIRSMGFYPKNVLEMSRFSNKNIGINNTQSSSYIARNDNLYNQSMGIIDMPSKYISVIKAPKTMILNTKSEIATINDQMINENSNNQEEILERYNTEVIAEQYDQEPNRINMKSLETSENIYKNLLRAGQIFDHQVLMEGNDARFLAEQNQDYPNPVNNFYQKLLRTVPRLDHQELMERSGTGFVTEQYYEDYPNQPYNTYQKLLRAGQENNHKELMESKSGEFIAKQYEDYQNQPYNMYQKLLRERQENNHQKLMESNDPGILAGKYYNEDQNRPNRKSIEINGRIRHIRPRFDHQELMERKSDRIEAEQYKKDLLNTKTMDSNGHIYLKSLESKPRFNHQEIMEKSNGEFEAGEYPRHRNPPKMKSLETNGRNYQKISQARPSLDHQELMERHSPETVLIKEDNNIIETEQNKRDSNEPNMKSSEISNPNTVQNLSGAIERSEQQKLEEENDYKIFSEQYYEEYSNQLNKNSFEGIANIDEPVFEDIGKPEKELMGRDNAEIIEKYKKDLFATNMKAKDIAKDSDSHMNQKLSEAARSGLELVEINNADTRHGAGVKKYKEHSSLPNINYLDMNANNHHSSFEGRNDKPINLDQKEVIGVIYPRLIHYIPRIQPLVVIPRFGCRLVPSCRKFYLTKRCTILKMNCGLI